MIAVKKQKKMAKRKRKKHSLYLYLVALNLLFEHSSTVQIHTKVTGEGIHYFSFSAFFLLLLTSIIFHTFCYSSILFGNFWEDWKQRKHKTEILFLFIIAYFLLALHIFFCLSCSMVARDNDYTHYDYHVNDNDNDKLYCL